MPANVKRYLPTIAFAAYYLVLAIALGLASTSASGVPDILVILAAPGLALAFPVALFLDSIGLITVDFFSTGVSHDESVIVFGTVLALVFLMNFIIPQVFRRYHSTSRTIAADKSLGRPRLIFLEKYWRWFVLLAVVIVVGFSVLIFIRW